jgi:16S rRNA (uracil1498-N3)-methyltransferase
MGAARIVPVITERTQVARFNGERAAANLIEAAEQCGIIALPALDPPARLAEALAALPASTLLVMADENADDAPVLEALSSAGRGREAAVLVGPEGGFSPAERAMLLARPSVLPVPLGPRILRADTAAVAIMALVQATLGDW